MFGIVVDGSQDGWPSFQSAYTLSPLLTFRPLLACWASHEHLGLFLSYRLIYLYTEIRALWFTYALFRSFRRLGLIDILSSLFCYLHDIMFHYSQLFVSFVPSCWLPYQLIFFVSFHSLSTDLSHFIAWSIVISPFTSHPMDIGPKIVKKVILSVRVYIIVWELSISLCILVRAHALIFRLCAKKKKRKKKEVFISLCIIHGAHVLIFRLCAKKKNTGVYMYVLSYSIKHVVVIKDCFVELTYWWEFVCELSNPSPLGVYLVQFVRERDEWPFPRDSGLLSILSFHQMVI